MFELVCWKMRAQPDDTKLEAWDECVEEGR
jgi:hypothetical protein